MVLQSSLIHVVRVMLNFQQNIKSNYKLVQIERKKINGKFFVKKMK